MARKLPIDNLVLFLHAFFQLNFFQSVLESRGVTFKSLKNYPTNKDLSLYLLFKNLLKWS